MKTNAAFDESYQEYKTQRIPYSVTVKLPGAGENNATPPLFQALKKEAKRRGISTADLAAQILSEWAARQ